MRLFRFPAIAALLALAAPVPLALAACATVPSVKLSPDKVDAVLDRYDRLRTFAELLIPYLPPARQAAARVAIAVADRAAAALRVATTLAEQNRALAEVNAGVAGLDRVVEAPDIPPAPS